MPKKEQRTAAIIINDGATVGPNSITAENIIGNVQNIDKIEGSVALVRFLEIIFHFGRR